MMIQKISFLVLALAFAFVGNAQRLQGENHPLPRVSVLTVSPGQDLQSLFGHSAIRYQDTLNGQWVDWVYHFGVYDVGAEHFYLNFTLGKLDYLAVKEEFAGFYQQYILEGRGVMEQVIHFDEDQAKTLMRNLEEQIKPENAIYRYDYFYNNCATQVRDALLRAASGSEMQSMVRDDDSEMLIGSSPILFTQVYAPSTTFRRAIQTYLDYQPWSDFGIDVALGAPCDRRPERAGLCFLPDSLMAEVNLAALGLEALASQPEEILPIDRPLVLTDDITPLEAFSIFLLIYIAIGWYGMYKGKKAFILDRVLFFATGCVGVLLVFLWLFTDHHAAAYNWNLLWANPLHLFIAFAPLNPLQGGWRALYRVCHIFFWLVFIGWFFIPQQLNLAVIPIVFSLLFSGFKWLKPHWFSPKKTSAEA